MNPLSLNVFCRLLCTALLLLPSLLFAQVDDLDLRLPWAIDAETTSFDGKESMIVFTGLRLSQGRVAIEADEGRATNKDQEQGVWQFSGNVIIDVQDGHIECDAATLRFDNYRLTTASVSGTPATFRLVRPGGNDVTYAEAGRLAYDVASGVIEFSEQATITEAGNQISSNFLVYNIIEQRISADSNGTDDGRVRITYTPTNGEDADADVDDKEENP